MPARFLNILISLAFLLLPYNVSAIKYTDMDNNQLVSCLDSVIAGQRQRMYDDQIKIQGLRERLTANRATKELYWLNKSLFEEFSHINSDSAYKYANASLKLAQSINDTVSIVDTKLNLLSLYNVMGYFDNASDMISELSEARLNDDQQTQLITQILLLQSNKMKYNDTMDMSIQGKTYQYLIHTVDDLRERISRDNPMYDMLMGWKVLSEDPDGKNVEHSMSVIHNLEEKVNNGYSASANDPMYCYMLGTFYKHLGDKDKYMRHMLLSAIAELSSGELQLMTTALNELSALMHQNGDLDHALQYVNEYSKIASALNNKPALVVSEGNKDLITQAYIKQNHAFQKRLQISFAVTTALTALILIALVYILRQVKKIKRQKTQLEEANRTTEYQLNKIRDMHDDLSLANRKLESAITDLSIKNDQLNVANHSLDESNLQKEQYITMLFFVCTDYIAKMDEYRKTMSRKLKTGQIEDMKYMLSQSTVVEDSFKEFYKKFDEIFLSLYPDFVGEFNKLLLPDEQIVIKNSEKLNTELRIFALQRLGISDADKISELLHCSVQTVYNSRQRTYKRTAMQKKDFIDAIMGI